MNSTRRIQAFTLIELLVVIGLVAVIAAVVAPNLLGKAGDANRKAAAIQIEKVANSIELYRLETGRYPEELQDLVEKPAGVDRWDGPYLRKRSALNDPWGTLLVYRKPGEHGAFDVVSLGGDAAEGGDGDDADLGNWE